MNLDTTSECAVCSRLHAIMFDFFAHYQYELSYSGEVRQRHAELGGFCPLHTWQYAEIASPRGICTAYAVVCRAWSERLSKAPLTDMRPLVPGADRCPACSRRGSAEQQELEKVAASIFAQQDNQPPLCLIHLQALARLVSAEAYKRLVQTQAAVYAEIAEHMENYARNDRPGVRERLTAGQRAAHRVGLSRLVGHKRLLAPWEFERTL
jgi:hypothetical protein